MTQTDPAPAPQPPPPPAYAELWAATAFSFQESASLPEELVVTAAALGLHALAVTDRASLAGAVRAHVSAKEHGVRLIVGARLDLEDAPSLLCLPTDRAAYGRLCRLLTRGRRRAGKGACCLRLHDLNDPDEGLGAGQIALVLPPEDGAPEPGPAFAAGLAHLRDALTAAGSPRVHLAAAVRWDGQDGRRLWALDHLAKSLATPLVAANDVRFHAPERRALHDLMTCVRDHVTIDSAGWGLLPHGERHLKSPAEMAALFARHPAAVARTVEIADACRFSLDELRYEYPEEPGAPGETPQQTLVRLTWEGARGRYPGGVPADVEARVTHEFGVIEQLGYAPYFLTVHDIVRFARGRGILCQGRGSAANSAVCYCLGITAVDPARIDLLFERFVSAARDEPPDIDVDFEHERREEVIQYIYDRYGRHRAGLAATVIRYRTRSATRDIGKAMGLSEDAVAALNATVWGTSSRPLSPEHVREAGLDPDEPRLALTLALIEEALGFPRHLSQHVGGFVLTRGALSETVPIENAAMADRTVIQWDKDDLDALGILKIDVLALGMLTCIRKAFELIGRHHGRALTLAGVPAEDPAVYDMLCRADSLGVFQVESRAQMSMLPRLRPRTFYDLVIEVAIVRPGPIQGDMVHPYLRRRRGEEAVVMPSTDLARVLEKTLGVPLFQEQAMRIAIVGAGFSPAEADRLRRAMATFRKAGLIHAFRDKFLKGMVANGYEPAFAENCFRQIEGFGEYGFPESHAASFALLVYVSAWLKRHYPAAFACALLNSQPMGFYAPAQIVRDAREHGVEVRPVDINRSDWECGLERPHDPGRNPPHAAPPTADCPASPGRSGSTPPDLEAPSPALRLGFRQIKGLSEEAGRAIAAARPPGGYHDPADVQRRAGVGPDVLDTLARADAFAGLNLDRRPALWAVKALRPSELPLFAAAQARTRTGPPVRETDGEPDTDLPDLTPGESVVEDYAAVRLTLRDHPMALLRETLTRDGAVPAARLAEVPTGRRLSVAGLAVCRQRPGSASGVVFITLEDETGVANLIVWPGVFETHRRAVLRGRLLLAQGRLQKEGLVIHLVAERLADRTDALRSLVPEATLMDSVTTRADRVRHNRA
ncbi:error-prone DNA polymerase [Roseospira navarrensis]|uniref:Error-prone DNA polymerase n=1 Tax=Roseospira navarrensis TaxID=140058 RepID=A0A7X2D3V8_9PROT|nr:error-prone DNA polymerase [Roseospira navarrensis]MQX36007.1 DNA polymerase III subunit alpha [Roseospira navarrensis]